MRFYVYADGSGKFVRVTDRIAGLEAFNRFVDKEASEAVDVASNDGSSGNIDLAKRLTAQNPWTIQETDYNVRQGERITVDD
jgi:hypothetical protein